MAACLNGIAAHGGLRAFGSTFLVFSDYMKPAIRLAAIMRLPIIYIGTHDSIGLGEDGPTHQPVEHLAMLRSIPNLVTLRPADATETIEAWRTVMARKDGPTMLVLSRQKLAGAGSSRGLGSARGGHQGAYVLWEASGTGGPEYDSDRHRLRGLALRWSAARLASEGRDQERESSRCHPGNCSLPSRRRIVEAGAPGGGQGGGGLGGGRRCLRDGPAGSLTMGMVRWGGWKAEPQHRASGLYQEFKLTPEHVAQAARRLLPDRTTRATGKDHDR